MKKYKYINNYNNHRFNKEMLKLQKQAQKLIDNSPELFKSVQDHHFLVQNPQENLETMPEFYTNSHGPEQTLRSKHKHEQSGQETPQVFLLSPNEVPAEPHKYPHESSPSHLKYITSGKPNYSPDHLNTTTINNYNNHRFNKEMLKLQKQAQKLIDNSPELFKSVQDHHFLVQNPQENLETMPEFYTNSHGPEQTLRSKHKHEQSGQETPQVFLLSPNEIPAEPHKYPHESSPSHLKYITSGKPNYSPDHLKYFSLPVSKDPFTRVQLPQSSGLLPQRYNPKELTYSKPYLGPKDIPWSMKQKAPEVFLPSRQGVPWSVVPLPPPLTTLNMGASNTEYTWALGDLPPPLGENSFTRPNADMNSYWALKPLPPPMQSPISSRDMKTSASNINCKNNEDVTLETSSDPYVINTYMKNSALKTDISNENYDDPHITQESTHKTYTIDTRNNNDSKRKDKEDNQQMKQESTMQQYSINPILLQQYQRYNNQQKSMVKVANSTQNNEDPYVINTYIKNSVLKTDISNENYDDPHITQESTHKTYTIDTRNNNDSKRKDKEDNQQMKQESTMQQYSINPILLQQYQRYNNQQKSMVKVANSTQNNEGAKQKDQTNNKNKKQEQVQSSTNQKESNVTSPTTFTRKYQPKNQNKQFNPEQSQNFNVNQEKILQQRQQQLKQFYEKQKQQRQLIRNNNKNIMPETKNVQDGGGRSYMFNSKLNTQTAIPIDVAIPIEESDWIPIQPKYKMSNLNGNVKYQHSFVDDEVKNPTSNVDVMLVFSNETKVKKSEDTPKLDAQESEKSYSEDKTKKHQETRRQFSNDEIQNVDETVRQLTYNKPIYDVPIINDQNPINSEKTVVIEVVNSDVLKVNVTEVTDNVLINNATSSIFTEKTKEKANINESQSLNNTEDISNNFNESIPIAQPNKDRGLEALSLVADEIQTDDKNIQIQSTEEGRDFLMHTPEFLALSEDKFEQSEEYEPSSSNIKELIANRSKIIRPFFRSKQNLSLTKTTTSTTTTTTTTTTIKPVVVKPARYIPEIVKDQKFEESKTHNNYDDYDDQLSFENIRAAQEFNFPKTDVSYSVNLPKSSQSVYKSVSNERLVDANRKHSTRNTYRGGNRHRHGPPNRQRDQSDYENREEQTYVTPTYDRDSSQYKNTYRGGNRHRHGPPYRQRDQSDYENREEQTYVTPTYDRDSSQYNVYENTSPFERSNPSFFNDDGPHDVDLKDISIPSPDEIDLDGINIPNPETIGVKGVSPGHFHDDDVDKEKDEHGDDEGDSDNDKDNDDGDVDEENGDDADNEESKTRKNIDTSLRQPNDQVNLDSERSNTEKHFDISSIPIPEYNEDRMNQIKEKYNIPSANLENLENQGKTNDDDHPDFTRPKDHLIKNEYDDEIPNYKIPKLKSSQEQNNDNSENDESQHSYQNNFDQESASPFRPNLNVYTLDNENKQFPFSAEERFRMRNSLKKPEPDHFDEDKSFGYGKFSEEDQRESEFDGFEDGADEKRDPESQLHRFMSPSQHLATMKNVPTNHAGNVVESHIVITAPRLKSFIEHKMEYSRHFVQALKYRTKGDLQDNKHMIIGIQRNILDMVNFILKAANKQAETYNQTLSPRWNTIFPITSMNPRNKMNIDFKPTYHTIHKRSLTFPREIHKRTFRILTQQQRSVKGVSPGHFHDDDVDKEKDEHGDDEGDSDNDKDNDDGDVDEENGDDADNEESKTRKNIGDIFMMTMSIKRKRNMEMMKEIQKMTKIMMMEM
ncbi:MATH and LRR domain-containing protein PFE0570w-like [Diaphorina citri]|uniref:MATH and LRR domain-containing protein PFE0570w-like n=1 Tax=Diaphorina citri TaxID=121845 RepID=A0A1S4ECM6_DIACI|nr:MATH and LRR domain-containing protein PFE0570w-like [Diaphorina citri]